ncbi:cysteine-rich CWC family protein [Paraburkholderia xenovorans]|uniref:cysteine-rich CWC family protein n=1 Tax=Paraburkholderia xenovorans TaxID=36873 RepID=UPI0038B7765D
MKPSPSRTPDARCPRCGRAFDCGMHAQPFDCWCRALPALPADRLDPGGRCLCPECLAEEIARVAGAGAGASDLR